METMTPRIAFLDTTVFLHCLSPEQIDWCSLFGVEPVVLVVPGVVSKQLQDKKDIPKSAKIRKRASEALKNLDRWADSTPPVMLRPSVELRFRLKEAQIDFAQHHLSRQSDDDRLLASMLEFIQETGEENVFLITDDVGLKLEARNHGIEVLKLPDSVRLPEELDDSERQIRELRARLSEYENRMPDLALIFEGGSNRFEARLKELSPDELGRLVAREMDRLSSLYPFEPEPPPSPFQSTVLAAANPLFAGNSRYNRKLDKYFGTIEDYLYKSEKLKERIVRLELSLVNTGSCVGENTDIIMRFPVPVFDERRLPLPERPEAPRRWDNLNRYLVGSGLQPMHTVWSNVRGPEFERKEERSLTVVRFHIKEAKHGLSVSLDPLFVFFDSWDTARSFTVPYAMYAANVPRPIERDLHVNLTVERVLSDRR